MKKINPEIFLNSSGDVKWLKDTHLKDVDYPPFKSFILEGNEDSPDNIKLFSTKNPNLNTKPIFSITGDEIDEIEMEIQDEEDEE